MTEIDEISELRAKIECLIKVLSAAEKALRSYQFGNSAPDLAEEVADACAVELAMLDEVSH